MSLTNLTLRLVMSLTNLTLRLVMSLTSLTLRLVMSLSSLRSDTGAGDLCLVRATAADWLSPSLGTLQAT